MADTKFKKSFTRPILISIGIRIGVVIMLMTGIAYYYVVTSLEASSLEQLDKYVTERGQRERAIFQLSEGQIKALREVYLERWASADMDDLRERFHKRFMRFEDGVFHNRLAGFDATKQARLFLDEEVVLNDDIIRKVMIAYDIASEYGRVIHDAIECTYFSSMENMLVGYWPERAMGMHKTHKDNDFTKRKFMRMTGKADNPERGLRWTGLDYGKNIDTWLMSSGIPIDVDGEHYISLGQLLTLGELIERTISDHLEGGYNVIISSDGQLVAHNDYLEIMKKREGRLMIPEYGDAHLLRLYGEVKGMEASGVHVFDNAEDDEYISVAYLDEPGWYFLTVLPKSVVRAQAMGVAWFVLLLGFCSLVIEVCVLYYVLKTQVEKPLKEFEGASAYIIDGVYDHRLEMDRDDELGRMADSFNRMAGAVSERDRMLEENNAKLEERVRDRTVELEKTHRRLVDISRVAGMSQVASNVLHKVGNIMNSINISVGQIRSQVGECRVRSLAAVGKKLRENYESTGAYLVDEEQGENLVEFIDGVGVNMETRCDGMLAEVDGMNQQVMRVCDVLDEQKRYTHRDAVMVESSLGQVCRELLEGDDLDLSDRIKIKNLVVDERMILVDGFKLRAILSQVLQFIGLWVEGDDAVVVELAGELVGSESMVCLQLRHGVSGCEIGSEQGLFTDGLDSEMGCSLHFSATLAGEVKGRLEVESLGVGEGMVYRLMVPYGVCVERQAG